MTDKRFKAPDGQEYEESFLIERYGQEKFDAFVADQTFLEIPDGEQTILDEDEFTAPDGKKYSQSFLVERYGQKQFDTFVEDGTFKKKNVIDSDSSVTISEFQGFDSIPKPKAKTIDQLGMYPSKEEVDAAFKIEADKLKDLADRQAQREAERQARFDINDKEALAALQKKEKQEQEKILEAQKKDFKELTSSKEFIEDVSTVTSELAYKEQDEVASILNKKFGKYGFIATPVGQFGRDAVHLKTIDGKNRIVLEVDAFSFDSTGEPIAESIKEFINTNARSIEDSTQVQTEEDLKVEDEINKAFRAKQMRPVAMVNSDGSESTVKFMSYEEDGKYYVAPTLFPKDPDNPTSKPSDWFELNMNEAIMFAKQRGEVFEFDTEEAAEDFAEGSWKDVSTADSEADKFYADRGLDYFASRKAYDDYQDLSEEIDFLEDAISGREFEKRYEESLTPEEKAEFGELYVNGKIRSDAQQYVDELKKRRDDLSGIVMLDEEQVRAREDFDEYLIDRVNQTATVAAESNRDAKIAQANVDASIRNNLGISPDELQNYVPKTEREVILKNKYIEDLVTVDAAKSQAALKYEVAKTFYNKKVNKSLQGKYIDNLEAFNTAVSNGYKRGQAMEVILAMSLGIEDLGLLNATNSKKKNAELISKYLGSQSPNLGRVSSRYAQARTAKEVADVILDNPLEWSLTLMGESLSQMLPYGTKLVATTAGTGTGTGAVVGSVAPGAGTVAGGLTGLSYGVRTGMAATSFAMEYTNSVLEGLEKNGYNYLDPKQVEEGLEDQKVWDYANDVGAKRGTIIGLVDFASSGLAGRVFKPASKLASKGTRMGLFAAERAIYDPAAEGFGEYLAQIGSGQEVDFKEIIAEMGGAIGNQISTAGINVMMDARRNTNLDIADFLANDLAGMVNDRANDVRISNWANNMLSLGKINEDQAQRIQENVGIRRQVNDLLNVSKAPLLPSSQTKKVRTRLSELIEARNQLTQTTNTKEIFKKKISDINAEIAEISETNKIPAQQSIDADGKVVGIGVDLNNILGKTERKKAAKYLWGGKMVAKDDFLNKIDNLTSLKRLGSTTVVGDPEVALKLKAKLDAIQKPSTEKVDVSQRARDGETLGERDTQVDSVTEEVTQVEDETQTQETQQAVTISPTPVEASETITETFTPDAVVENVIVEETQEPTGVQIVTKQDNTFAVVENDVVIEDNIETKEAALDVANKTAPVIEVSPEAEVEVESAPVFIKPLKKHKTAYENNTLEETDRRGIIAYALDKKSKGKRLTTFENTIIDTSNQETVSDIQMLIEDIGTRQRQREDFDQEVADLEAFINEANPQFQLSTKEAYNDAYYQAQLNADKLYQITNPRISKYSQFINLLKRSFPNVEVIDSQEGFDNLLANPKVVALTTKGQRDQGEVYGAVFQGKLYLNPATANLNTPIHEFGHIWNNIAKQQRPELYKKGLELIETDNTYVKQIENSTEYQRVIKQMQKEGRTEQEVREFILEEALATAIGDKGESFANAAVKKDFKNWLKKLYRFVKSMTGLSQYTDEQLQDITLDEFLQGVVVDLLSGEQVFKDAQVKEFPGQLQLMTGITVDEASMTNIISAGREQGFSDAVIKEVLKGRGFKATDINKAMIVNLDNTLFEDVVVPVEFGNMEGGMEQGQELFYKIRKKLQAYAQPRTTKRTRKETEAEKAERATMLRAANTTLFALTDQEILRRYPRIGVTETVTIPPKTKSEIRAKALELLKSEAAFQAQPETTQQQLIIALDKTIGTRANKVVSREINALKQRIKDYQRGIKDIQDAKRILRDYIRKALPKSDLYTKSSITKLVSRIAKATSTTILSDVEFVDKQVEAQRQKMKKQVIKKMAKLVSDKSKKFISDSKKAKSKGIAAEAQAFFEASNEVFRILKKNDTKAMLNILTELSVNEDVITQAIIKELNGKSLEQNETRLVNLSYAFDNFSELETMSLEETIELYNAFKDVNAEGIKRFKSRKAARAQQIANINKQAETEIKEGFPEVIDQDGDAKNTNQLQRDKDKIEKLYQDKKIWEWVKAYKDHYRYSSFADMIRSFKNNLKHLGTLANKLDRKGNFFTENLYNRLNRADESNMKGYFRTMEKLDEIANSVDGITKGFREIRDKIYQSGTIDIRVRDRRKDGSMGSFETESFNRDQLLRIYSLYKNDIQRGKLEKQGFDRETMQRIEEFLGPEVTDYADKIVYFLSNEYYNETNNVYRSANDVNLNYIQNYFPTQTISTTKGMDVLLTSGNFNAIFNAESSPALKRRGQDGDVKLKVEFTATLVDHVKAMERYKAYAIPTKILQGIFSDPYVKSLLDSMNLQSIMRQAVNYAINPDSYQQNALKMPIITKLQSRYTSFALALKIMQIPKQMSSFVNAFENYSFRKGVKTPGLDLVMFMVDASVLYANILAELAVIGAEKVSGKHIGLESRPLTEAIGMSGSLKKRIELGVKGDLVGLEAGQPTFRNKETNQALWAKLGRGGRRVAASPTVIGDIAGVMGYMINYRRNIKNGISKAKALEEFNNYNATQQSRRATEKIPLQMNPNAISRSLLMFGSTLFLQMNKVMSSSTNILRGMNDVRQAVAEGDMKKAKQVAKNIKLQDIRGLYLNLAVANVMFTAMANMFKLTSDDPEDRAAAYQRMQDAMFGLNLIYAIPFVGVAVEQQIINYRGERRKVSEGVNPLNSVVNRISNEVKYDDSSLMYATAKNLAEIAAGIQIDPALGLGEAFTGEFDEDAFYDLLGVSYSYRPGTSKKKKKSSSTKKSGGGIEMEMD